MAIYKTTSLGVKLEIPHPFENADDFDKAAGKTGACLEGALDDTVYRGTLPDWQAEFGKKLVAIYGERQVNADQTARAKARAKTDEAKAKVKDVYETWTTYTNRIKAGMTDEQKAEYEKLGKDTLAEMTAASESGSAIDPSPSKRAARIPAGDREKAESLLTLPEDQLEAKITKWGEDYPSVDVTAIERDENGRPTVESLARTIGAVYTAFLAKDL